MGKLRLKGEQVFVLFTQLEMGKVNGARVRRTCFSLLQIAPFMAKIFA